jgi:hypothetical protein
MGRLRLYIVSVGALLLAGGVGAYAFAGGGTNNQFKASKLVGYEENPDISTAGTGSLEVSVNNAARTLTYTLRYSALEGDVQQAHIHFGKRAVNGGVVLFLCSNLDNAPAGTPTCPQSGTVTRTVAASEILAPEMQGLEAGNFAELVAAMRAGRTYANVHSTKWPSGEIRSQLQVQKKAS